MIEYLLKQFFKFIDVVFAHQSPSRLGFGHQITTPNGFDSNIKFIIQKVKQLPEGLSVLELACGQGTLAIELSKLGNIKKIKAIDIDTKALEKAKGRAKKISSHAKLQFACANFLSCPAPENGSFDVVIADKFLHILTEPEICNILYNTNHVLNNAGIFFINTVSTNNFVYSCTTRGTSQSIHRLLKNDIITRNWYNIKNPIISFISKEWLEDNANRYGFIYDKNLEFYNKSNYLTVGIRKVKHI